MIFISIYEYLRAYLVRPDMDTGAYIHMGPPGPIVELPTVSYLLKIYMKVFNYFTNYLETWSQVRATGFWVFVIATALSCYGLIKNIVMATLLIQFW